MDAKIDVKPLPRPTPQADEAIPRTMEDLLWKMHTEELERLKQKAESEDKTNVTGLAKVVRQFKHLPGRNDEAKSKIKSQTVPEFPIDPKTRRLEPVHPLAQLLLNAARLFEEISTFQNQKVLEQHLFPKQPDSHLPLHPRRTLDQAYSWKLRTTRRRDRDQVVYRYTRPRFLHRIQVSKNTKTTQMAINHSKLVGEKDHAGSEEDSNSEVEGDDDEEYMKKLKEKLNTNPTKRLAGIQKKLRKEQLSNDEENLKKKRDLKKKLLEKITTGRATQHDKVKQREIDEVKKRLGDTLKKKREDNREKEKRKKCRDCREQSHRVAQAIMVDQLWMWILDENTIITFFPQRYGVSRKDPSGVHFSIRKRLGDQSNLSNHVRSVFDLALIILDECFNTFFDRTKSPDGRPQVLDIFAESIGRVVSLSASVQEECDNLMI